MVAHFNKLSENINFYISTVTMGVVFDLLRAIAEYWFRIRKRKSEGVRFCLQVRRFCPMWNKILDLPVNRPVLWKDNGTHEN